MQFPFPGQMLLCSHMLWGCAMQGQDGSRHRRAPRPFSVTWGARAHKQGMGG